MASDKVCRSPLLWTFLYLLSRLAPAAASNKPCSKPCDCASRLTKILSYYDSKLKSAKQTAEDNKRNLLKLQIALHINDETFQKRATPILVASGEIVAACDAEITQAEKAMTSARLAAAMLAKGYFLQHAFSQNTGQLKLTAQDSGHFNQNSFTQKTIGGLKATGCGEDSEEEKQIKVTEATAANGPEAPNLQLHQNVELKCDKDKDSSAICSGATFSENGFIEAKIAYAATAVKEDLNGWSSTTHTTPAKLTNKLNLLADNVTNANTRLNNLKKKAQLSACTKMLTNYADFESSTAFKRTAIKTLVGDFSNEKDTTTPPSKLEEALKEAYGTAGDKLADNIWKKVSSTMAPASKASGETKTRLDALNDRSALTDVLSRLSTKQLLALQVRDLPADKVDIAKEKDCSSRNGDDCKGDCKMIDGVCKQAMKEVEEENKEKDAKAASTCTGKDEKTCKSPDCKWEGKECKDSTFLTNEKFALMAAAFASFVAS
uniref:Variant surface glycoprotein (VSG), putative n=1 Tax=Trypanosoma brucei brucei (strain 927/4 GUTat10.1) TaxID=185431 RepID=Q4FKI6_TRYB2|nr:variant surface glycoprotein (VSG), putative [Trypanosoma brucei brucei TREU927]